VVGRVDREHDNMRAALGWALDNPSDAVLALRLAGDMSVYWWLRGFVREGRAWLARALTLDERQGTIDSRVAKQARRRVLRGAGILARNQDDFAVADSMFSASLALSRELDDAAWIAEDLFWLGSNALLLGDEPRAQAMAEESVELYRQFTDPQRAHWIYGPLGTLASLAWRRGDSIQTKPYSRSACATLARQATQGGSHSAFIRRNMVITIVQRNSLTPVARACPNWVTAAAERHGPSVAPRAPHAHAAIGWKRNSCSVTVCECSRSWEL
jgi:hypothetical protein